MSEQLSGAALNRAIAEVFGWTVRNGALYAPGGTQKSGTIETTDDRVWELAGRFGMYPRYATDANAVIAVLGKTHHVEFMEIDAETGEFLVCLAWLSDPQTMGYSMHYGRSATSYQEAAARALLAALTAETGNAG